MENNEHNPEIGYDHPTTKALENPENLKKVEGLALYHEDQDRYELLSLEYDNHQIDGPLAMITYQKDLEILYQDVQGNTALDTGEITWKQIQNNLLD